MSHAIIALRVATVLFLMLVLAVCMVAGDLSPLLGAIAVVISARLGFIARDACRTGFTTRTVASRAPPR